eukprot:43597-Eustigmatos_ZCMA.PRE.1
MESRQNFVTLDGFVGKYMSKTSFSLLRACCVYHTRSGNGLMRPGICDISTRFYFPLLNSAEVGKAVGIQKFLKRSEVIRAVSMTGHACIGPQRL